MQQQAKQKQPTRFGDLKMRLGRDRDDNPIHGNVRILTAPARTMEGANLPAGTEMILMSAGAIGRRVRVGNRYHTFPA